jgi:hypothetical protein
MICENSPDRSARCRINARAVAVSGAEGIPWPDTSPTAIAGIKISGKISGFLFFHPCFPEIQPWLIFAQYPNHTLFHYSITPDAINRLF